MSTRQAQLVARSFRGVTLALLTLVISTRAGPVPDSTGGHLPPAAQNFKPGNPVPFRCYRRSTTTVAFLSQKPSRDPASPLEALNALAKQCLQAEDGAIRIEMLDGVAFATDILRMERPADGSRKAVVVSRLERSLVQSGFCVEYSFSVPQASVLELADQFSKIKQVQSQLPASRPDSPADQRDIRILLPLENSTRFIVIAVGDSLYVSSDEETERLPAEVARPIHQISDLLGAPLRNAAFRDCPDDKKRLQALYQPFVEMFGIK